MAGHREPPASADMTVVQQRCGERVHICLPCDTVLRAVIRSAPGHSRASVAAIGEALKVMPPAKGHLAKVSPSPMAADPMQVHGDVMTSAARAGGARVQDTCPIRGQLAPAAPVQAGDVELAGAEKEARGPDVGVMPAKAAVVSIDDGMPDCGVGGCD